MYCAPTSDAVRMFSCMNGWQPFIDFLTLKVIRTVKVSKHKQQENCWVAEKDKKNPKQNMKAGSTEPGLQQERSLAISAFGALCCPLFVEL